MPCSFEQQNNVLVKYEADDIKDGVLEPLARWMTDHGGRAPSSLDELNGCSYMPKDLRMAYNTYHHGLKAAVELVYKKRLSDKYPNDEAKAARDAILTKLVDASMEKHGGAANWLKEASIVAMGLKTEDVKFYLGNYDEVKKVVESGIRTRQIQLRHQQRTAGKAYLAEKAKTGEQQLTSSLPISADILQKVAEAEKEAETKVEEVPSEEYTASEDDSNSEDYYYYEEADPGEFDNDFEVIAEEPEPELEPEPEPEPEPEEVKPEPKPEVKPKPKNRKKDKARKRRSISEEAVRQGIEDYIKLCNEKQYVIQSVELRQLNSEGISLPCWETILKHFGCEWYELSDKLGLPFRGKAVQSRAETEKRLALAAKAAEMAPEVVVEEQKVSEEDSAPTEEECRNEEAEPATEEILNVNEIVTAEKEAVVVEAAKVNMFDGDYDNSLPEEPEEEKKLEEICAEPEEESMEIEKVIRISVPKGTTGEVVLNNFRIRF